MSSLEKHISIHSRLPHKGAPIYFIGIGGIGMSAIARYFLSLHIPVYGYDRHPSQLTLQLEQEGAKIHYEENIHLIPPHVSFVVYTPAIPSNHAELQYFKANNYLVVKRSDVLQWITEDTFNICISGTHGKTTITTMVAHILRYSEYGSMAFLGGISANYNTNFWSVGNASTVVVEADEYDRSFLKLFPNIAVITAMDADHLDIYGTAEEVEKAFIQFANQIKADGCLIAKYELKRNSELKAAHKFTYSLNNHNADVYATDIKISEGSYTFTVQHNDWQLHNVALHTGGLYNIENAVAAITIAKYLGINDEQIKQALHLFKGVKRRFEYIIKTNTQILIDDYAHHPEELKALLQGVRNLYGSQKCTVVFQPHLYTRTRDLADAFAKSLDLADEVILLPVYPARELPIDGVSSELILHKMKLKQKQVLSKEQMLQYIAQHKPQLLVMCGAGDIDELVDNVKEILLDNNHSNT